MLFDPREGELRDNRTNTGNDAANEPARFGGIMHYIELDARNLSRWFRGVLPAAVCPVGGCTGANALNVNGYTVYFSDRRGNRNAAIGVETGEYGNEDIVNPATPTARRTRATRSDTGEDFNGNGALQTYGAIARAPFTAPGGAPVLWANMTAPLVAATTPNTTVGNPAGGVNEKAMIARAQPALFFRRALKLVNGAARQPRRAGPHDRVGEPRLPPGNWNANGVAFDNTPCAANPCAATRTSRPRSSPTR